MGYSFAKFNGSGIKFTIDTTDFEAHKASDLYKEIGTADMTMRGIYVNPDNGYGESVTVVTDKELIYFGASNVDTARAIREDAGAVNALNNEGAVFHIEEFTSRRFKNKGYKFVFGSVASVPGQPGSPESPESPDAGEPVNPAEFSDLV